MEVRNITLFGYKSHNILFIDSEYSQEDSIRFNRYMILHEDCGVLLGSSGFSVVPRVYAEMLRYTAGSQSLKAVLSSQSSGMANGFMHRFDLGSPPTRICEVSMCFLSNDGVEGVKSFIEVPDEGMSCFISPGFDLVLVPELFQSEGRFSVYDPVSKMLFTSEIGAAIRPQDQNGVYVDEFVSCLPYVETSRWQTMRPEHISSWMEAIAKLDVNVLAPRYGPFYRGQAVKDFLAWFRDLARGNRLMAE